MRMKTKLLGVIAALATSSAMAVPVFTVPGGAVLDPFGGLDWASNGTAFTTNFNSIAAGGGASFAFDITYFSFARAGSGILDTIGNSFAVPNLFGGSAGGGANPFELTIVATLHETATCTGGGVACTFDVNSGGYNIFLDPSTDARVGASATLAQYNNGTLLISGAVNPTAGGTGGTFNTAGGIGASTLSGTVTFTNGAFINPALLGSTSVTTLQLGTAVTSYARPTGIVGPADTCIPPSPVCTLTCQADANQSFTVASVPEPGSLSLLGLGLLGFGAVAYRKRRDA